MRLIENERAAETVDYNHTEMAFLRKEIKFIHCRVATRKILTWCKIIKFWVVRDLEVMEMSKFCQPAVML